MNKILSGDAYKRRLEREKQNQAKGRIAASVVDIYPPLDFDRVDSCEYDLLLYFKTYHKKEFYTEFCDDQIEQITDMQNCILNEDDKALAAMRGGGKTSICRFAIEWALLYGHSKFSVIVGATGADAKNNLDAIKLSLETNELLCEDFPHVCLLIRALEGSARKAAGQRVGENPEQGDNRRLERTRMKWETNTIQFPTIPDEILATYHPLWKNKCSGAKLMSKSSDGAIRGLNIGSDRPDLVLMDDLETRETVKSDKRTEELAKRIATDIGGLAAQGASLTKIYIGTIMSEESLTASYTDPKKFPSYNGKRYSYLKQQPDNLELWEEYMEIRQDYLFGGEIKARDFYKSNRKKMDKGAVVSWKDGYNPKKYESALEKYYAEQADKKEFGLEYCACELQNDPKMLEKDSETKLTIEKVTSKLSGLKFGRIPSECTHLSGFIDVHGGNSHLYFALIAFDRKFNGYFVDYGKFPGKKTLLQHYKGGRNDEVLIRKGLEDLVEKISENHYRTDEGIELNPRICIDSGWNVSTDIVYAFCRENKYKNCFPSKGESIAFKDYNQLGKKEQLRGDNWRRSTAGDKFKIPLYLFNSDYWKRFVHNRLLSEKGQSSLLFWGQKAQTHLNIARHILSEEAETLLQQSTGNKHEKWYQNSKKDNHLFDCTVGCHVVASIAGIKLKETSISLQQKKKRRGPIKATKL